MRTTLLKVKDTIAWEQAKSLIPNGCQTYSKMPCRFVHGVYPKFLIRGDGAFVEDMDGREYLDYMCSLGAIILGYKYPSIDKEVKKIIDEGAGLLSLPHPREYALAKLLTTIIPCAEKVKFYKTGSEAVSAAVRVARACTGKNRIITCGYHGWHDWYTILTDRRLGIPPGLGNYVFKYVYNDLESLEKYLKMGDIAAVVMEPVMYEPPKEGFLKGVRKLTGNYGALLVFDEMVTGFRVNLAGAQKEYMVIPDLACFGKAMGNGYPIAALVGKEVYMDVFEDKNFFISGTYGGDVIGISAAIATIEALLVTRALERIKVLGEKLQNGFNELCKKWDLSEIRCEGLPQRTRFIFPSMEHKGLFWQECLKRGILFGQTNFINYSLFASLIEETLGVCEEALQIVKDNWNNPKARMEGDVPAEVFASLK